jgi:hypothetical protein
MSTSPVPTANRVARAGRITTWAIFVAAVAIAGAGLTLALDHPQTDSGRPELTARGDALVAPRIAALQPALAQLAAAADEVATHARSLYGDLRARDTAAARVDLAAGDLAASRVTSSAVAVKAGSEQLLLGTSLGAIGAANRVRVGAIERAVAAAAGVPVAWAGIAGASVLPISAVDALARHDTLVLAATELARASDFAEALHRLNDAKVPLEQARTVTDQALKAGRDARTLFEWITRSANYDDALTGLYALLVQTGGVMTPEAQVALDTVKKVEALLPTNTSGLVVIVSDLGGQQMTLGLIELDRLRGEIAAAVDAGPSETAPAGSAPADSPAPGSAPAGVSPLRGVARR